MHVRRVLAIGAALTSVLATTLAGTASPAAATNLERAVELTGHQYGKTVEDQDVRAGLDRIGHNAGSQVDKGDRRVLVDWADNVDRAVRTALDQVGDEYEYGGTGPGEFDCSGLTRFAWAEGGVDLPHSSRAQADMSRSVSMDEIRPGDLLFFYRPVSHVAIYVGDGKAVEAKTEGRGVRLSSEAIHRGDLVKIGRVY